MDDLMGKIQEVLSDEESMKQLSELASALFSSSDNDESAEKCSKIENTESKHSSNNVSCESSTDFDFSKLLMMGQLMNNVSDDKNTALLMALKPLLKEERQEKIDKAVKLLKLFAVWSVLKESGMLGEIL